MGEAFKAFIELIKRVHWLAAGLVAVLLWIFLGILIFSSATGVAVSGELMVAVVLVAAVLTVWALDGLIKSVHTKSAARQDIKKRRRTIRDLTASEKNVLFRFLFARRRKLQKMEGSAFNQLVDIGVLELLFDGVYEVTYEYWDLLFDEGWNLLYKGQEQPRHPRPDWAVK